jgi:hypothetical protein
LEFYQTEYWLTLLPTAAAWRRLENRIPFLQNASFLQIVSKIPNAQLLPNRCYKPFLFIFGLTINFINNDIQKIKKGMVA